MAASSNVAATIATTPAARPSTPSRKLMVFCRLTNQTSVTSTDTIGASVTIPPGSPMNRMEMSKPTIASSEAATWKPNLNSGRTPPMSSKTISVVMTAADRSKPSVDGSVEKSAADSPNPRYMASPPRRAVGSRWMKRSPGLATAPSRKASHRTGSTTMAVQTSAASKGTTAGAKRAGEKSDQKVGSLKTPAPASTRVSIVATPVATGSCQRLYA